MHEWTTLSEQATGSTGENIAEKHAPISISYILRKRNNRKCLSSLLHGSGRESLGMERKCVWDQCMLLCER